MTFPTHKYFSSEDLDFRNLTKFILHFSTFFYKFLKFSAEKLNKYEKKCKRGGADDWAPHAREPSPPPSPASPARVCAPWPATTMGGTAAAAHLPAGEVRTAAQQGGPRPRRPDGSGARAGWGGGARGAAAACGVPPVVSQDSHGVGRHGAQGSQAASRRAGALRELAQGGPAACAGGERGAHGGAAAPRRRWRWNRKGKGSRRTRGLRGSSPRGSIGRRTAGEGSSA